MATLRPTFRHALPALLCGVFSLAAGPLAGAVHAAGIAGVFDAGWSTAYYPQDSITHMHQRLHALGMDEVVLQYAAVEATHLYYPSQLDFLQNTQYKNNELFPKSIEAAKTVGTKIWLGLYYNGENWYTPPTAEQLDTLSARNLKVLEEIYALYGSETVVAGVYIPQEIARYYWDGLRDDATPEMLTEHFLKPVTEAAQAKGWKVMAAPFYNQNLETPEKLQSFFGSLFAAGFKPDIIAVQDGVGASDAGRDHADTATVGNYERAVAAACKQYGIDLISLIAPTSDERISMVASSATGFIYIVSSLGVTGVRSQITTDIPSLCAAVKAATDVPCAIGFGISTPEQAAKMAASADGVIVGSAIVKIVARYGKDAPEHVGEYVKSMVDAIK